MDGNLNSLKNNIRL